MRKTILLNDIIISGEFDFGIKAGLTKTEIEKRLGKPFGNPDITTPDIDYYCIDFDSGLCLVIIFLKNDLCFEAKINLDENGDIKFKVEIDGTSIKIDKATSLEKLISILSKLKIEWNFDAKKVYLQTVCIKLENGLRMYYYCGDRGKDEYGLYVISTEIPFSSPLDGSG